MKELKNSYAVLNGNFTVKIYEEQCREYITLGGVYVSLGIQRHNRCRAKNFVHIKTPLMYSNILHFSPTYYTLGIVITIMLYFVD